MNKVKNVAVSLNTAKLALKRMAIEYSCEFVEMGDLSHFIVSGKTAMSFSKYYPVYVVFVNDIPVWDYFEVTQKYRREDAVCITNYQELSIYKDVE